MSTAILGALKALAAGLIAALSFAIPIVDDGVEGSELLGILLAFVVGSGIVYYVPNFTRSGEAVDQPPPG